MELCLPICLPRHELKLGNRFLKENEQQQYTVDHRRIYQ